MFVRRDLYRNFCGTAAILKLNELKELHRPKPQSNEEKETMESDKMSKFVSFAEDTNFNEGRPKNCYRTKRNNKDK